MSALNITAARSDPLAPSRFTIIMQANSFAYFVLSGVATGISSRARRRESAAYSNGISLDSFNHWHYSNPDNCRCSGHRRLPRVYYEYNEPRSTWTCSFRGWAVGPPEALKKISPWQVPFFSDFQSNLRPIRADPNFSFWNELMDGESGLMNKAEGSGERENHDDHHDDWPKITTMVFANFVQ